MYNTYLQKIGTPIQRVNKELQRETVKIQGNRWTVNPTFLQTMRMWTKRQLFMYVYIQIYTYMNVYIQIYPYMNVYKYVSLYTSTCGHILKESTPET